MSRLGTLLIAGMLAPGGLSFALFHDSSVEPFFSLFLVLALCLVIPCVYFCFTLLYIFILGRKHVSGELEGMYTALAVTDLSFGIDLLYCYFLGLTLVNYLVALIMFHLFFVAYMLVAYIRVNMH